MVLTALILIDMVVLAVEIWLTAAGLGATAGLCAIFLTIRAVLGTPWVVNTAMVVAGASAMIILSQAGQSPWGSNLMLYLLPVQMGNATAALAALLIGRRWGRAS